MKLPISGLFDPTLENAKHIQLKQFDHCHYCIGTVGTIVLDCNIKADGGQSLRKSLCHKQSCFEVLVGIYLILTFHGTKIKNYWRQL
jgi:hypothetical protein